MFDLDVQLLDVNAKLLELAINSKPVRSMIIPPIDDEIAAKVDRCTTKDALLVSDRFTNITTFGRAW